MHHRNQAADERRRRMLLDESCSSMPAHSSSSTDEDREEAARAKRSYTSAARSGRQPRLIDLVPKRWPAFLAHITLGALAIAGLDWLARNASRFSPTLDSELLALFEPAALGSLTRWLASLWLLTAAALSVIIYTIRRHKADDYRGGYRAWLWAAVLLTVASLDAATSIHRLLSTTLVQQFGTPLGGNGHAWWLGTWGLLLGLVGLRLVIDMRASRAALTAASLAALLYVSVAITIVWPPLLAHLGQNAITVGTVTLVGHLFCLTALALNTRYVFLDAQGLIAARESRKSRRERAAEQEEDQPKPARAKRKAKKVKAKQDEEEETANEDDDSQAKPRRFLFWTIRSAEDREAARREKEDERELRREAKLEARREARENKEAARAEKLSARDSKREEKSSALQAKRNKREQQQADRQAAKQAKKKSPPKEQPQDQAEKSSPLAGKIRKARDNETAKSNSGSRGPSAADADDEQHLSKAERKRLKKQRRREMREAA